MDCSAVKPRMEALVSGSLPAAERSLAEQHVAMCEGCRLELELVRAVGSQEKPPAGSSGSKEDWTLDRIFGAEGPSAGGESAPEKRSPAEAAPPASEAPPTFGEPEAKPARPPHPAMASSEDGEETDKAPSGRKAVEASWSFEPADAKANMKPPEQSLFFAAEALSRNKESASRRGSNARVAFWGLGGIVGVGLLAFSAWFVLHMEPASEDPASRAHPAPVTGAPDGAATPDPAAQPDDGSIQHESGEAPDNSAQVTPPATTPRVTASNAGPQPMPLTPRGSAMNSAPKITTPAPKPAVPKQTAPKQTAPAPVPRPTTATGSTGATEHRVTLTPNPDKGGATTPEIDASEDASGQLVTDLGVDFTPKLKPPSDDPTTSEGGATTPKPKASMRGSSMWQPHTPKPEEPVVEPPSADTPTQRLHLATVAAAEKGDVLELRRLRTSWKALILKTVGPDRARAKREVADCLWTIQDTTGRRSDQKDALAAYREYLLGAPAGGADSRSVSRLRQLEDALAESR